MPKFSKQSRRDLQNAVRRYNSMRTRFINQNHPTYEIPKADINAILKSAENTQELRENIKRLNDLKKIQDFNLSQEVEFNATIAEVRTFKRLNRAINKRYKDELNRLQLEQQQAVLNDSQDKVYSIMQDIAFLKAKPTSLQNIHNRKSLLGATSRISREILQYRAYGTAKKREREYLTKERFIAALGAMGLTMLPDGQRIVQALWETSNKDWIKLQNKWKSYLNLEYVYNPGVDAYAKLNQLKAIFDIDIEAGEMIDDTPVEVVGVENFKRPRRPRRKKPKEIDWDK